MSTWSLVLSVLDRWRGNELFVLGEGALHKGLFLILSLLIQ